MTIAIMGAMPEEISSLLKALENKKVETFGNTAYYSGKFNHHDIVIAFSGWGKVAASATAAFLIAKYDVDCIIFTGVAGAINTELNIGDVIVATELYQHDVDATPFFKKNEIPLTGQIYFPVQSHLQLKAFEAAERFLTEVKKEESFSSTLSEFGIHKPKVKLGKIASGDRFIKETVEKELLKKEVVDLEAVEMEGAAVAQVCYQYKKDFIVIRTISDKANEQAEIDFQSFILSVASEYSLGVIKQYLK